MRKVLLVTIQNLFSLGNRLQNYALQTVIERQECEVHNLSVVRMGVPWDQMLKYRVKQLLVRCGLKQYADGVAIINRTRSLAEFNQKRLHNWLCMAREDVDGFSFEAYDAAVTGSDQVWHNWHRMARELPFYYLSFMPEEKRVAYAPSFGFTSFPAEDLEQHRAGLMGMARLSGREQEGCGLIRQLTGREAEKVLDPTMLLTAVDWEEVEEAPRFGVSGAYVLQFMLGRVTSAYQAEIDSLARQRGLRVIDINRMQDPEHYGISPAEFVWLIHHASAVCTDSFHASVFAVLFERDLRVFERQDPAMGDMFGRLRDLLGPLGLTHTVFGAGESLSTALSAEAKERLLREREKSLQYLRESLGTNDAPA